MSAHIVDAHILQTVPPSNLNRDDTGAPKSALYGGVRRSRVSSQAWKRAARLALPHYGLPADTLAVRSRRLIGEIADRLAVRVPDVGDVSVALATASLAGLGLDVKKDSQGNPTEDTEYLLFLGRQQLDAMVEHLVGSIDDLVAAQRAGDTKAVSQRVAALGLPQVVGRPHAADVALFGRMVADTPGLNVEAACAVAHALSVHAVESEFDYFTAVDDLLPESETGAAMIGTVEFNAATLYRYATLDVDLLADNLGGDRAAAGGVVRAFLKAFTLSMPSGKAKTFANYTPPALVFLAVRQDQPVNLVGAFEKPIRDTEAGHLVRAARELVGHHHDITTVLGTEGERVRAVAGLGPLTEHTHDLAAPSSLDDAVETVCAALTSPTS